MHVVTLRGGRTGRVRGAECAQACGRTLAAPAGARVGAATQRGRNFGPTRGSRHAAAHHPLGRRRGILAAAAPQAAYPLARLGLALGEPEGAGWPTRGTGAPSNPKLLAVCLSRNDNRGRSGPGHTTPEANSRVGV